MNQQYQFQVTQEDHQQRLDVFLAARLGHISRMRIAGLLAAGACLVDQTQRPAGYHVKAGETVDITVDESLPTTAMTPEAIPLAIVYEDEAIIVVNKPSGMLVHPNIKTKSGTLANALAYYLNRSLSPSLEESSPPKFIRPGLVHRLDRLTSGLLVVAKTQRALSILTQHFHNRLVKKLYTAVVWGVVGDDEGVIEAPIGINPSKSPPRWVLPDGKDAETRFFVSRRLKTATLVDLEPVTGRTNQLRVHCAYIGHPIIGDELYGGAVSDEWPLAMTPRLCLHAARLEFHHPNGGRRMRFHSPLPDDMQAAVESLE